MARAASPWRLGRLHVEIARGVVPGLTLCALTALWMTASTFGFLPDESVTPDFPAQVSGEFGVAPAGIELRAQTPVTELRELRFPSPGDATDVFTLHTDIHMFHRIGWLRAAVLGANDGLVSTASMVVGVAAAGSGRPEILIAGLAGLVAGAMSMAAGEYVSVSSQTDAEQADIAREIRALSEMPEAELDELTAIHVGRGLDQHLARQVAVQLTETDALGAHAHVLALHQQGVEARLCQPTNVVQQRPRSLLRLRSR